ncbi:hypothetical protein F4678DRAFT_116775 [Xylaria arbuscula]|nr:hypothetical protein F4678DRAFT_116775 [Xylaria arbuscula]
MATNMNASARPTLAPLWTNHQSTSRRSSTAFRAAQAPLLSPSPMSAASLPSPIYPTSYERLMRKKDRALLDSLSHKVSPSSAISPKSFVSIEGQSPLVSKLEQASVHLTDAEKCLSPQSPSAAQGSLPKVKENHDFRPQEDYGNIRTADAFVVARSIRRNNNPAGEDSRPYWEGEPTKSEMPSRLTLRAIIRPKAPGRQTFLIQRNLDIDELRATASTKSRETSHQIVSPSRASRKPLPVPAKWSSNSRRPSTGASPSPAERPSKITSRSTDYDKLIRDPKTIPIHIHYTASALPALTTLLTSGHIRRGDVIYLPVPHVESWPQTVLYVYTGHGELTTAIRENILYLGGRV